MLKTFKHSTIKLIAASAFIASYFFGIGSASMVNATPADNVVTPARDKLDAVAPYIDAIKLPTSIEGAFAPAIATASNELLSRQPAGKPPTKIVLDQVKQENLKKQSVDQPLGVGVPLKIGFARDVLMLKSSSQTKALLDWSQIGSGQIAAISVTSPDASGVRLGLLIEKIPDRVLLRFYSQDSGKVFEVSGKEIMETLARNFESGDKSDEARTYWSPVIEGQEITLEIELSAGVSIEEVVLSIPRISHLFSLPLDTRSLMQQIGESQGCNLDSVCYSSIWENESRATAKMVFTKDGVSYICTGTLLMDTDTSTNIPYFLSANHCISTQTVASSLQTYWFYRSSNCNSGIPSSSIRTMTSGATLLYQSPNTDTSFMRLNSNPPSGVVYALWYQYLLPPGFNVASIHHPNGDLQKISFGTIIGYNHCVGQADGSASCNPASSDSANNLAVSWGYGMTEGGSSGSGLWFTYTPNGNRYLIGTLFAGGGSCWNNTAYSNYARFDIAYNAALSKWLFPPKPASRVIEFYNSTLDHYFITADANEAAAIDKGSAGPGWIRTGFTFVADGDTPVCRFYGSQSPGPNSHFYTADANECSRLKEIQAHTPATERRWNFEGLDFNVTLPVTNQFGHTFCREFSIYRAYNNGFARGIDSNHRYTDSPTEIERMKQRGWIDEGVVMCYPVPPSNR